ncbi:MAG: hypothetical protein IJI68_02010, partial [Eggerthellaceae bacterium]|nr:hypothetical protein [Eggerthellaceae bacterium]
MRAHADDTQGLIRSRSEALTDLMRAHTNDTQDQVRRTRRVCMELVWADVFNQAIEGCPWLEGVGFNPGRWAVGYPFLYVLFRLLSNGSSHTFLDLGLGQTSTMLSRYAGSHQGVTHTIVEHDQEWISYYKRDNDLPPCSTIHVLPLEMIEVETCEQPVRRYANFESVLENGPFDLVTVDAPFGYDMKELARIDVLDLVPDSLAPSFVILVDDFDRKGEKNMVDRLAEKLSSEGIEHVVGVYEGEKQLCIIASKDNEFALSL